MELSVAFDSRKTFELFVGFAGTIDLVNEMGASLRGAAPTSARQ